MNKFKINFRMTVTALLPLLFLPIMCFHYVPKVLHEVLGILWLLLVLIHIGQNRQWFASLKRGRWPILRLIGTVIDILLLVVLLVMVGAGSGISNHLFKEIMPLDIQRSILIHQLHVSLPYALLILCGLHWGLHWRGWLAQWKKLVPLSLSPNTSRITAAVLGLSVAALGIYGSFLNRVGDRLLMKHIFATEAANQPGEIYALLLMGLLGLYVVIGFLFDYVYRGRKTQ
jgi:hypothetical protein